MYGSGLSEWDLAESTPGTREYLFTLSLGIRGGMYYVVMVHTPETKKSHRVKQALTHTIYTYTGRGVLMLALEELRPWRALLHFVAWS